jgi:hypothetical protein
MARATIGQPEQITSFMKTMMKAALFCVAIGMAAGCASRQQDYSGFFAADTATDQRPTAKKEEKPPKFTRGEAEEKICITVVRRFTEDASSRLGGPIGAIYLSVGDAKLDAPESILSRASIKGTRVRRASEMKTPDLAAGTLGSERQLALTISRIDWIDYYSAQAFCAWNEAGKAPLLFSYDLVYKSGSWRVL